MRRRKRSSSLSVVRGTTSLLSKVIVAPGNLYSRSAGSATGTGARAAGAGADAARLADAGAGGADAGADAAGGADADGACVVVGGRLGGVWRPGPNHPVCWMATTSPARAVTMAVRPVMMPGSVCHQLFGFSASVMAFPSPAPAVRSTSRRLQIEGRGHQ